ncbi:MAG: prepilin-type N-terminal cleavage/methylation domain-containing protein [Opitutales bacterium]|nr:prepilin-type N-terminal cleavage/methylation domain-containing protein [Opitutales bacterium]
MQKRKGFTLVEIMIVVVIIGLLAVMALPAFNKVRQTSQTNVVINNLRQLANAADQHFIETGETQATWADLVGTDKYVKTAPKAVGGESYANSFATINQGFTQLTINVPALNTVVTFNQ